MAYSATATAAAAQPHPSSSAAVAKPPAATESAKLQKQRKSAASVKVSKVPTSKGAQAAGGKPFLPPLAEASDGRIDRIGSTLLGSN